MRLLARLRAWRAQRACRRGRHDWQRHDFVDAGVATVVPACRRDGCSAVNFDELVQTVWNRSERRRWRKLARSVHVRGA